MPWIATATAVSAIVAAGLVGLAGTADASGTNAVIKQPTWSYTSPSTDSVRVQALHQGERVEALCLTEGQERNGNFNWFRIKGSESDGYVHRDAISAPTTLPHC
jgi:hypothetical protein